MTGPSQPDRDRDAAFEAALAELEETLAEIDDEWPMADPAALPQRGGGLLARYLASFPKPN